MIRVIGKFGELVGYAENEREAAKIWKEYIENLG